MMLICPRCRKVYDSSKEGKCPHCGLDPTSVYDFRNSEEFLEKEAAWVRGQREEYGLKGLVGGLEFVVINTEPGHQRGAVEEFLRYTGHNVREVFENDDKRTCVLGTGGSADILVNSRRSGENPFGTVNRAQRTEFFPNTRLETFVFGTNDLEKYFSKQRERGIEFLTEDIVHAGSYSFLQTPPSRYTGNSTGFVQWKGGRRNYAGPDSKVLDWVLEKPDKPHLGNVKELDHVATRVRARDRDSAIAEFMNLTNYDFKFAIYVNTLNSITNVARLKDEVFGMVFTSGISPFTKEDMSGPTEMFVKNYGTRAHHMAFRTERIEDTYSAIRNDGMEFLVELVGSPADGLKQTFTMPSRNTLLVNEYIQRYEGFDGFFTKSNVTELTRATGKQ